MSPTVSPLHLQDPFEFSIWQASAFPCAVSKAARPAPYNLAAENRRMGERYTSGSSSSIVVGRSLKMVVAQCPMSASALDTWLIVEKVVVGDKGGGLGTAWC